MSTGAGKAEAGLWLVIEPSISARLRNDQLVLLLHPHPNICCLGGSRVRGGRGPAGSSPAPTPTAHRQPFLGSAPTSHHPRLRWHPDSQAPDSQAPAAGPPLPCWSAEREWWSQAPPRGVLQTRWAVRVPGTPAESVPGTKVSKTACAAGRVRGTWVSTCLHRWFERLWNAPRPEQNQPRLPRGTATRAACGEGCREQNRHRASSSLATPEVQAPHLPLTAQPPAGPRGGSARIAPFALRDTLLP